VPVFGYLLCTCVVNCYIFSMHGTLYFLNYCRRPNIGPAAAGPAGPVTTALLLRLVCFKDARLSESEKQKYNRLSSIKFIIIVINLPGEDAVVGVVVMLVVVVADVVLVGVDVVVLVVVSAER